jgi:hypothetical protein
MDMYFEDQKCKILKYIDDRGEELARLLYKFKVNCRRSTWPELALHAHSMVALNRKNSTRIALCGWTARL